MIHDRNLSAGDRGSGLTVEMESAPGGLADSLQFTVEGHAFIAIPHMPGDTGQDGSTAEGNGRPVGRIACSGRRYLVYDAEQERQGRQVQRQQAAAPDAAPAAVDILTCRELQVASLIAEGKCDKEIARQLGISGYTVREHIRRIFAKLNIGRRSAVVARILRDQGRRRS
jgi:DNA-binding CsgD family transcriptional regulator